MIPKELIVFENKHWIINHRENSAYPGYLMVASKERVSNLSSLCFEALQELGSVLAEVEKMLNASFQPIKVVFSKLGFSEGFGCHFHAVPVAREVLEKIRNHSDYTNEEPDGLDVMLFINREYCEGQDKIEAKNIALESVAIIRNQSEQLLVADRKASHSLRCKKEPL